MCLIDKYIEEVLLAKMSFDEAKNIKDKAIFDFERKQALLIERKSELSHIQEKYGIKDSYIIKKIKELKNV